MMESMNAPRIPLITMIAKRLTNGSFNGKSPVSVSIPEPTNTPEVPRAVMPPDVPVGTAEKVSILLGWTFDKMPISVPHVSAVAAASEPRNIR